MNLSFTLSRNEIPPPPKYVGWRSLHKQEGGYQDPPWGMPQIRPGTNSIVVKMNESIQWMSYQLMTRFNPAITPGKWTAVHGNGIAFCNGTGFGVDPRANFVTGENLTSELPKYDKVRHCAGAFIRGIVEGNELVCYPGIHAIDGNKPMPTVDEIINNVWYFTAVTSVEDRANNFPQGAGGPVVMPFIMVQPTKYPLSWFTRWEADVLPDPLRFYLLV